ncbi:MAG: hypothetical protein HY482_00480 [Candidatus Wildermuthbacteria bacterium]|nr:hypothetical protein [Candidatus Wildermuthbacteria bacterium]
MATLEIERTRTGKPAYWVGGGSFTSTFRGRYILTRNGDLAKAIFIRRTGDLASREDQVLVSLKEGYFLVEVDGSLGARGTIEDLRMKIRKIKSINSTLAEVEEVRSEDLPFSTDIIPAGVASSLLVYHNRDGSGFAAA